MKELTDLLNAFTALSENAYCSYIDCCRAEACLGWEGKMEHGEFGNRELEAHKKAAEYLGRHRAYNAAATRLKTIIDKRCRAGIPSPT